MVVSFMITYNIIFFAAKIAVLFYCFFHFSFPKEISYFAENLIYSLLK